jgi:Tfp pilus assembly protein PilO
MSSVSRGVVYSLLAVVLVLLLGIMALLGVSYNRHQRLEDATADLKRNLSQQESKIADLQERLEGCDTIQATVQAVPPVDTSWNSPPAVAPKKAQNPSPEW